MTSAPITMKRPRASGDLRPRRIPVRAVETYNSPRWLLGFVFLEIACQLGLLIQAIAPLRVFVRSAALLSSIAFLLLMKRGPLGKTHPAQGFAMASIGIVAMSIPHPGTNSLTGGIAAVFLYMAILGPIFWVPRIRIDVATVRWLFMAIWAFNTLSAIFGALQVYFPGHFEPAMSVVFSDQAIESLQITLVNGARVSRPMGLTDSPGGAGIGAAFSIILGIAFLLDRPKPPFRVLLLGCVGVACFSLYLCQVRSLVVMTLIALIAMALPFALQGRVTRYVRLTSVVLAVAVIGFSVAVSIGGKAVTGRLSTLIDDDVTTVYLNNRGGFLVDTFQKRLPQFPLGAGLGRWGMLYNYFGDPSNADGRPLWAEIQWTGWLYDGGAPLLFTSLCSMLVAVREALRTAVRVDEAAGRDLYKWATVLVGFAVGTLALTFNSCPFAGTMGVDFWVLSAAVFAASTQMRARHAGAA